MRIQVRSFNAVCRMVAAGVGIGMVPRSAVPAGLAEQVVTVEITDDWAPRDLQLCVRSLPALSPAAAALYRHLAGMGAR